MPARRVRRDIPPRCRHQAVRNGEEPHHDRHEHRSVEPPRGQRRQPVGAVDLGVSTLHCLTVSLAPGGAGLGTAWGHRRACQPLEDVGFADVSLHDAPGDPLDIILVATKP